MKARTVLHAGGEADGQRFAAVGDLDRSAPLRVCFTTLLRGTLTMTTSFDVTDDGKPSRDVDVTLRP